MTFAQRLGRLRAALDAEQLDGFLVSQPESRYYLSGYTGHDLPPRDSAGYLLVTREQRQQAGDGEGLVRVRRAWPAVGSGDERVDLVVRAGCSYDDHRRETSVVAEHRRRTDNIVAGCLESLADLCETEVHRG